MDLIKTPIKGLLFDKDGTLFDFNATWGAWTREMLHEETATTPENLVPMAEAFGFNLETGLFNRDSVVIAGTVEDVAALALPFVPDTSTSTIITRFNEISKSAPQAEATPLAPFLSQLRDAGFRLGVATNDAEQPARTHLDIAGATPFFEFIAGFDSGFGGKPEAGQLHAFCAATGLLPAQCAMIGDSTHDLHAAKTAGMVAVAVLTGVANRHDLAPHADVVLESIADLPEWLGL